MAIVIVTMLIAGIHANGGIMGPTANVVFSTGHASPAAEAIVVVAAGVMVVVLNPNNLTIWSDR